MKLVITRVKSASVEIDRVCHCEIGAGLLILCGVAEGDTAQDAAYLAKKAAGLRIFEDDAGKMNLACSDVGGEILVVSNFTLCGDTRKGNRPSFVAAARPELAEGLYEQFVSNLREYGYTVKTGVFGADMKLASLNDGPVTILMDSRSV